MAERRVKASEFPCLLCGPDSKSEFFYAEQRRELCLDKMRIVDEPGKRAEHFAPYGAPRNAAALARLDEAGASLIPLHLLNVSVTLHLSLLSTNAIENVLSNDRGQTARGTRLRAVTDQISRWSSTARLHVENGFHRIMGAPKNSLSPSFSLSLPGRAYLKPWPRRKNQQSVKDYFLV